MQINRAPFLRRVIDKYEGGYCWDKGDPGGPTNFGITCYDLAEERHQTMTSMSAWAPTVKAMPESEALGIYNTKYCEGIGFDQTHSGPDCVECDYGINSGLARVKLVRARLLQLAKKPTVNDCDTHWYIDAMCDERLTFMKGIRGGSAWEEFGRGWGARVADLRAYCHHLASAGDPKDAAPAPVIHPGPKATHDDPTLKGHVTATVTAHTTATTTAAVHGTDWPLVVGLGVIGLGGIALYAMWRYHGAQVLNATVVLPPTIPPHP